MKRWFFVLFAALMLPALVFGADNKKKKADKNTKEWYYELEACSAPYKGASNIKVWSYGANAVVARDQAMKNAVHGVIFRGIPGNPSKRINALPPLVDEFGAEDKYGEFFDRFFADGGDYLRYVTKTGSDSTNEVLKYDRKNYKVGVIVTVQYDALREMLEKNGIIKSLASGFTK